MKEASEKYPELIEVRRAIESRHFEKCMPYAAIVMELCTIGYLVLRGTCIVLPNALQALTLAYEGHLGIVGK